LPRSWSVRPVAVDALRAGIGAGRLQGPRRALAIWPDDQTGATNRVTPAVTKAAAAEIQTGVVTRWPTTSSMACRCSAPFQQNHPDAVATMPGAEYGKNKMSYMEDTYLSQSHVGTHIDGMGHIGVQDCYYNQTPMGKYVTQNYLKRLASKI